MINYELLKAMHTVVRGINDEGAYMDWIYIVPDEATDEDLMDIALDAGLMEECLHLFRELVKRYCNKNTVAVHTDGKSYL